MQAICQMPARPAASMLFARRHGRDYMMRSEKRTGYGTGAPSGGKRPPKRRHRRAGFFYILLALLLSVLLWPVGMILLWRRKVHWRVTTKLLASIITLVLFVTLYGFGLTVQTDNPTVTMVQDKANDFLDASAVHIANGYSVVCDKAVEGWQTASDVADGASRAAMTFLADGIDRSVELSRQARETASELFAAKDESVEPSLEPSAEPSLEPSAEPTTPAPTATSMPTDAPATDVPDAFVSPDISEAPGALPLTVPSESPDPDSAQPIGNGKLTRDRDFTETSPTPTVQPTEAPTDAPSAEPTEPVSTAEATSEPTTPRPTETPEPTAAPTVDPDLTPKPAGEAVVYYNSNGVNYHMASSCKNMKTASAGTLADAVEKGLRRCKNCETPDAAILDAENVVWVDEAGLFHLSDGCADFTGIWSLMTLEDALANGNLPCAACKAGLYMAACGQAVPTATPGPTPTPSPSPSPTPTPEPAVVTPSRTLKPAGEALVYHSSNGKWYHTEPDCSGMGGAKLYPLSECVDDYKRCRKCDAPLPELVDEHCLWMDENGQCHTTDECPGFAEGKYTLVPRDEALAAGYDGCAMCGADEYLVENTIIEYPEY